MGKTTAGAVLVTDRLHGASNVRSPKGSAVCSFVRYSCSTSSPHLLRPNRLDLEVHEQFISGADLVSRRSTALRDPRRAAAPAAGARLSLLRLEAGAPGARHGWRRGQTVRRPFRGMAHA